MAKVKRLHYICPLTISKTDAAKLRKVILAFIDKTDKIIESSQSEGG